MKKRLADSAYSAMTYPMTIFQYGCQLDESLSFSGNRQRNTFCEITVIILCICFVYSSGNKITTTTTIICDHNIMTFLCMAGIPIQDIKHFNVAWIDALFDIKFFLYRHTLGWNYAFCYTADEFIDTML